MRSLFILLGVLFALAAKAAAPIMSNGGFEIFTGTQDNGVVDTFGSWTTNHVEGGRMEATASANAGTNAVKLITVAASKTCYIYQDVTVSANTVYSLNAWVKLQTSGAASVERSVYDLSNSGSIVVAESCGITTTSYGLAAKQFTTPSGCTSIRVYFLSPSAFSGTGYVDTVSITLVKIVKATYYIDYDNGLDSNDGTSTNEAWKRSPYMVGFSGSYVHFIGDRFLFKGGVTWPVACFPMAVTASGVITTNDLYTVTNTYYSGGSWTRPVFNLAYTAVSSAGNSGSAVYLTGSNLTIYGLEIKGLLVNNSTSFNAYGVCSISGSAAANNVTVQNCYIHNWRSGCSTVTLPNDIETTDSLFGGVYMAAGGGRVIQCTIGWGEPPAGAPSLALLTSGGCVSGGVEVIRSNVFEGCVQFTDGGAAEISYNYFRRGTNSYDPDAHSNAIIHYTSTGGRIYIFNNIFHDLDTKFQTMLLHAGQSGATNTAYYVYNNIAWNVASAIDCDESGITNAGSGTRYYIWNNTIQNNNCVASLDRGQSFHIDILDCRNNHWISDTATSNPIQTEATAGGAFSPVGTLVDSNNLWHTSAQAATAGYNIGNMWRPTLTNSATIGYGANLTSSNLYTVDILGSDRGASGAWDSGAYEYVPSSPPAVTLGPGTTLGLGITIR